MIQTPLNLSIGNCTDADRVEELFGSVSEFARLVEENGNEFVTGEIRVEYDANTDIHYFFWE